MNTRCHLRLVVMLASAMVAGTSVATGDEFALRPGDSICYIGNTLADRMQHHGWMETYLHGLHPDYRLTVRNLGFPGDEVVTRSRSDNFGSPDQWLTKCQATVVFCFFGYNEALRGPEELAKFAADLAQMIDHMRGQKYDGQSPPRLVVFSPIAHENLDSPHLPDGSANNKKLALYAAAMREVCLEKQVRFVDLFAITQQLYAAHSEPLTLNGIHLLDHGNRVVADAVVDEVFGDDKRRALQLPDDGGKLRDAVLDKNYQWFSRYRVVDGYNVYGGRSKLAWHGQSNADVMRREMEIFDVKTANRDERIWAVAQGNDLQVTDDNLPTVLEVKTNKPGPLEDESFPYLGGEEAIEKMEVAEGMQVNLFASEEMFPRLVNPVQMAVDTDSRLWASVWPSYPHWNPTQPRRDAIVILPDDDADGVADELIVFADELNSVTGFEFWGGGVLVAAPPEIWFLKDTDGDDRADFKRRMLQGVSSADTHHSANAMLVGPDGWLYWSRGIFNVANFETPTTTYRSGQTGVHRFNPRTFETEFHFPIGPNPHGDVFDRWGYQFANDGTSGTGSYVNIGKGVGNKQWFTKRVRPVAATGLLSSSHFPPENNENFLICNTIGVLGVLQHTIHYDGADITAREIEPIVLSSDQNFRPSDVEVGGDGALYISDWHNVLIGHMQHNMRDPNRDDQHGRIYRVSYPSRPLLKPAKMKGQPIPDVLQNFFARENGTRYRTRLELSGRDTAEVTAAINAFTAGLDPRSAASDRDEAQALLECLWVLEEHRVPNADLLATVFQAEEPRVRAAAIRTLGHWAGRIDTWEPLLTAAARDDSALVRAEAVKSAVEFTGNAAAEVVFEVAERPTDPELLSVLDYARRQLDVGALVRQSAAAGRDLSPAARRFVLQHGSLDDMLALPGGADVDRVVLGHDRATPDQRKEALADFAERKGVAPVVLLVELINEAADAASNSLAALGRLLLEQPATELAEVRQSIERMAAEGKSPLVQRVGYAAWVALAGPDDPFLSATQSTDQLRRFLEAVPLMGTEARSTLYEKVAPLTMTLPPQLEASHIAGPASPGVRYEFFGVAPKNVARETLQAMTPDADGVVSQITLDVPDRPKDDQFALRFTGGLRVARSGEYRFFTTSDDGSRLYVDQQLVVNNDRRQGMTEKGGKIRLEPGLHELLVTYFDQGGNDGLEAAWAGPGFDKQPLDALVLTASEPLRDLAVHALASIPGRDADKFMNLFRLIQSGRSRPAAIRALESVDPQGYSRSHITPLIDNLIGYLSAMPVERRTSALAVDALALAKSLAAALPDDQAQEVVDRLSNLDVRVIAIGTVPHRMIFDKERLVVETGKPVEFRFSNTDAMPHNFAIVMPGALEEVGQAAEATGRDPSAPARHYIPESDQILLGSRLLQPGEQQALSFEAPTKPGVYPFVCTYPGHWRRMHGALYVVADPAAFEAEPQEYLAAHGVEVQDELLATASRGRAWTFDDLIADVEPLPTDRSFEVGRELFKAATCTGCHQLGGEGRVFGPDLAKLDDKKRQGSYILRSIVEPSRDIEEKYQSYAFQMAGNTIVGMIIEETEDQVHVVVDPLAKDKATVLDRDEIDAQKKSEVSQMPLGLLDRFSREEILDLIAYVYAGGDMHHKIYKHGHHH